MVIASLVSRSMLDTLELRERLKEFSRLSAAAGARQVGTMMEERGRRGGGVETGSRGGRGVGDTARCVGE